ncbi:MAG: Gmad2 immunoglobulin-like domain-containing protein [Patescibacteria group bacterium]
MSHFFRLLLVLLILVGGFWLWKDVEVEEVAEVEQVEPAVAEAMAGEKVGEVEEEREVAPTEFISEQGVVLRVTSPLKDSFITSPLTITGEAPGTWYFEASFPLVLVDWDGLIIAQGHAEAQSNWMTEAFVPFVATLTFTTPDYGENGTLILQKDNPSGLPENDDAVEVPIRFE